MALADYEKRNSKEFGGSNSEQTVTYHYRPPKDDWKDDLPDFGDSVVDDDLGTVYFKSYSVSEQSEDDDHVEDLALVYTTVEAAVSIQSRADGDELWTITVSTSDKPLEYMGTDYRMQWNFDLYQHAEKDDAVPAWGTTATDASDADGTQWKWAKESPGDDWILAQIRTKPGVEAFLYPMPVVRYEYWHSTKANVEGILQTVGTRAIPGERFGYDNDAAKWLVTGAGVSEDGTKYKGTVEFTYADGGWETDLYST